MAETFAYMLQAGGKSNSLGRTQEVIDLTLQDKSRIDELYSCLFNEDAWVRMRAADALEKVCRQHPEWIAPFTGKLILDFSNHTQPSIQWHLAQIYTQVELTATQKDAVIQWLKQLLATPEVDWIVAANAMDALVYFTKMNDVAKSELVSALIVQQNHKSKSVVRRAGKLLGQLDGKIQLD